MKNVDNKDLKRMFKVLLKDFSRSAEKEQYPIFPPEQVNILGSGRILCEAKNGAPNLREGLRLLGVTMYHLATGESEYNKTSYQIDGYSNRPLDLEIWPVISLLLSGNAFSIPQVKEFIGVKRKIAEKACQAKVKVVVLVRMLLLVCRERIKAARLVIATVIRNLTKKRRLIMIGLWVCAVLVFFGGIYRINNVCFRSSTYSTLYL